VLQGLADQFEAAARRYVETSRHAARCPVSRLIRTAPHCLPAGPETCWNFRMILGRRTTRQAVGLRQLCRAAKAANSGHVLGRAHSLEAEPEMGFLSCRHPGCQAYAGWLLRSEWPSRPGRRIRRRLLPGPSPCCRRPAPRTSRNVSTTLIHAGSAYRLGYVTAATGLWAKRLVQDRGLCAHGVGPQ
jgi:hypothetical protein